MNFLRREDMNNQQKKVCLILVLNDLLRKYQRDYIPCYYNFQSLKELIPALTHKDLEDLVKYSNLECDIDKSSYWFSSVRSRYIALSGLATIVALNLTDILNMIDDDDGQKN